jgi:hypothetical protein
MLLNTRTYTLDRSNPDANSYVGPDHSFSSKDRLELKRVYPKPVKDFPGVARPTAKLTKSVVPNATTGERQDAIVSITGSLPVGMTEAEIDGMLADAAAFLASTEGKALFKQLAINA